MAQTGADNGIISLPAIPRRVVSANVLGGGGVEVETRDGKLILHPRKGEAGRAGTVVKLLMDGPVMELPAVEVSR